IRTGRQLEGAWLNHMLHAAIPDRKLFWSHWKADLLALIRLQANAIEPGEAEYGLNHAADFRMDVHLHDLVTRSSTGVGHGHRDGCNAVAGDLRSIEHGLAVTKSGVAQSEAERIERRIVVSHIAHPRLRLAIIVSR